VTLYRAEKSKPRLGKFCHQENVGHELNGEVNPRVFSRGKACEENYRLGG